MKKFNPQDWLEPPVEKPNSTQRPHSPVIEQSRNQGESINHIEQLIAQIESHQIDITGDYSTWRNLGFALSDGIGETGRDAFHRISKFHIDYNPKECDQQFDACLKAKGSGVTISTLFHHAKDHGILINKTNNERRVPEPAEGMPNLPDAIFPILPDFLQRVVEVATSKEERDILLLGTMTTISSCLPKVFGIYDGKRAYPNLFLFVTAQASAGKGRLEYCKQIVRTVHKRLRERAVDLKQQYEMEMVEYNTKKGKEDGVEKPAQPQEKMLFIPANNSTTGVFQLLSDNDGKGLIFETEGDTLAQAFKSDYGNYSDGFRKAFHHETISYYRRTDREYVDIDKPRLSALLSGTPKQVSSLIPSAENGLFSRFMFYFMNVHPVWKDVFAENSTLGLDNHFDELSKEYFALYTFLEEQEEVHFQLTANQKLKFNQFFSEIQSKYLGLMGNDYMATVRRLGLIAFRISMIFSVLRIIDSKTYKKELLCNDVDFENAIELVKVLIQHSSKVFSELPDERLSSDRSTRKTKFFEALPAEFNRQGYLEVARSLSIPDRTVERYITDLCNTGLITRLKQDAYELTK